MDLHFDDEGWCAACFGPTHACQYRALLVDIGPTPLTEVPA